MAIYVDVSLGGTRLRQGIDIPSMKVRIKMGTKASTTIGKRSWEIVGTPPKGWAAFAQGSKGTYTKNIAGWYEFYMDGKQVLELRAIDGDCSGLAFGALNTNRKEFELQGTWQAAMPPGSNWGGLWGGFLAKGAASAGVRLEAGLGAVVNLQNPATGLSFVVGSGGLGASLGASAGLCVVLATGFPSAAAFHGYKSSGWDWDLSFGPKWSGMVKGATKIKTVFAATEKLLDGLEAATKAKKIEKIMRSADDGKEIYGFAKGLFQVYWIDDEEQNITAIDVPTAGGGAQIGIHFAASKVGVLSNW